MVSRFEETVENLRIIIVACQDMTRTHKILDKYNLTCTDDNLPNMSFEKVQSDLLYQEQNSDHWDAKKKKIFTDEYTGLTTDKIPEIISSETSESDNSLDAISQLLPGT